MIAVLQISKLEAAKRQLDTVICMYFNEADPVSIHTLTAAPYNLLRNINEKLGGDPMLIKDRLVSIAPTEYTKEVRNLINKAENFFKHADKDHDAVLEFNPILSEYLLLDACDKYRELSGEYPPLFKVFRAWVMMTNQDIFALEPSQLATLKTSSNVLVSGGKAAFFKDMLATLLLSAYRAV